MEATNWKDAAFYRFEKAIDSSTGVARVILRVGNEKVPAYVKPIGNRAGPHVLACEWVRSQLARWFGLSTLDFGIMRIQEGDEIRLGGGFFAQPGPAFVSRKEPGLVWSGGNDDLDTLVNPEDITRLVLFDSWILNADRFPPPNMGRGPHVDNVFLSDRDGLAGKHRILAMDHTHCFTQGREIGPKIGVVSRVKDRNPYGLFPQFLRFFKSTLVEEFLRNFESVSATLDVEELIQSVPLEWEVPRAGRIALRDLILDRARFLAAEGYGIFEPFCHMREGELPFDGGNSNAGK